MQRASSPDRRLHLHLITLPTATCRLNPRTKSCAQLYFLTPIGCIIREPSVMWVSRMTAPHCAGDGVHSATTDGLGAEADQQKATERAVRLPWPVTCRRDVETGTSPCCGCRSNTLRKNSRHRCLSSPSVHTCGFACASLQVEMTSVDQVHVEGSGMRVT